MTAGRDSVELSGWIQSREKIAVAEYAGETAGYSYTGKGGDIGSYFVFVYMSPSLRRRGIGTALYEEAVSRLRAENGEPREIFTRYFDPAEAEGFIKKLDFTYTTSSDIMSYSGPPLPEGGNDIRPYRDEDYMDFERIWSRGMYEMHIQIGLPVSEPGEPDPALRGRYLNDAANMFILECDGAVAGGGIVSGDSIGALAVGSDFRRRGYGSALAAYLTNEILRRGNSSAFLTCETGNGRALRVYEKLGYKKLYTDYWAIKNRY